MGARRSVDGTVTRTRWFVTSSTRSTPSSTTDAGASAPSASLSLPSSGSEAVVVRTTRPLRRIPGGGGTVSRPPTPLVHTGFRSPEPNAAPATPTTRLTAGSSTSPFSDFFFNLFLSLEGVLRRSLVSFYTKISSTNYLNIENRRPDEASDFVGSRSG